jgi:hypothetical protein
MQEALPKFAIKLGLMIRHIFPGLLRSSLDVHLQTSGIVILIPIYREKNPRFRFFSKVPKLRRNSYGRILERESFGKSLFHFPFTK